MSRRLWTGLLVGVLAAAALVAVGAGAFHAGERHSVVVAPVAGVPVAGVPGETVRVVGYGGHWGGPPFGFLFPLLLIGVVVLLIAGRRRAYWGHPYGPGWGGPGWGGGPGGGGREAMLAEWHRRAHGEATGADAPPGQAPTPGETGTGPA